MSGQSSEDSLPAGLELVRRIDPPWPQAMDQFLVKDHRLGGSNGPMWRLTVVRGVEQASWGGVFRERLSQLERLALPHVVRVRGVATTEDGDLAYVLEEKMSGSLEGRIADDGLDQDVAWHLFEQVLAGLAALHRQGIVHGDLRLENIMHDGVDGKGKLTGATTAWIAGVAVGPGNYWFAEAGGDDPPPHADKLPQLYRIVGLKPGDAPTCQEDLAALGALGCCAAQTICCSR